MVSPQPALSLSGRQVVVRGAAPDWTSGQAARCRMAATQRQPFGPGLFARRPASSFGRVRTYTPSFFLGLRANRSRRGLRGDREQALRSWDQITRATTRFDQAGQARGVQLAAQSEHQHLDAAVRDFAVAAGSAFKDLQSTERPALMA